jgi:hypothetical protein
VAIRKELPAKQQIPPTGAQKRSGQFLVPSSDSLPIQEYIDQGVCR